MRPGIELLMLIKNIVRSLSHNTFAVNVFSKNDSIPFFSYQTKIQIPLWQKFFIYPNKCKKPCLRCCFPSTDHNFIHQEDNKRAVNRKSIFRDFVNDPSNGKMAKRYRILRYFKENLTHLNNKVFIKNVEKSRTFT